MDRQTIRGLVGIGTLVVLVVIGIVWGVAYAYLKPTAAASGPIETVALTPAATTGASTPVIFEIVQDSSQARYVIDEVLRDAPVIVTGETNQVSGQVATDLDDLASTQLGIIQINARTFTTTESQRDRAVQNRILLTDQYEYITFTPTALLGLPEGLTAGETATFQVVGDLTIRGVAREVTFDATLTPMADDRLSGSATTTVRYADWGISIPAVPFVASVEDEVRLDLTFEAEAAAA
jgi:polyisoprenoid-binding protein YceI